MDYRNDLDVTRPNLVDHAVTVDEPLADRLVLQFRNDSTDLRLLRNRGGEFENFFGDTLGVNGESRFMYSAMASISSSACSDHIMFAAIDQAARGLQPRYSGGRRRCPRAHA